MSHQEHRIPVFVYPPEINFYLRTESTYKQLLTLYNPYDFPVKYKVLSNARDKYSVIEPTGTIASKSYIDMVIRHNCPLSSNVNITDKFMITMQELASEQKLGKRIITATLHPGERTNTSEESSNQFSQCGDSAVAYYPKDSKQTLPDNHFVCRYSLIVAVAVVLLAALFLPTKEESPGQTLIPKEYHVSATVKIFCGFLLGMITMVVLRLT